MAENPIVIDVIREPNCVVIAVAGEVDLLTANELRDALMTEVNRSRPVVVDLTDVDFLSSNGLATLAMANRAAADTGSELRVVATSRVTLRPLQITGMTAELAVFSSRADAVAAAQPARPSSENR